MRSRHCCAPIRHCRIEPGNDDAWRSGTADHCPAGAGLETGGGVEAGGLVAAGAGLAAGLGVVLAAGLAAGLGAVPDSGFGVGLAVGLGTILWPR